MGLIWFEGFEGLGVTEGPSNQDNITEELRRTFNVTYENSTSKPYLRPGDLQGKALAFQNTNTFDFTAISWGSPFDLTDIEFVVGFRYKTSSLFTSGTNDILIIWGDTPAGTPQIRLRLDASSTNTIEVYRGNTLLNTSATGQWSADEWNYFELKIKCSSGTSGSYTLKVNDTTVLSDSGINTLESSTLPVQLFRWYGFDAASDDTPAKETMIDDVYLLDTTGSINNSFLGADTIVVSKAPIVDGTVNDFTPQSGVDNYAMVDENPASAADYNDGATNGDIDEYGFAVVDQDGIYGVMVETHVQVQTEGRERRFRHRARSGASVGSSSDISVTDDVTERSLFEVDPNTSGLWNKAALNSAEFGVEVRD